LGAAAEETQAGRDGWGEPGSKEGGLLVICVNKGMILTGELGAIRSLPPCLPMCPSYQRQGRQHSCRRRPAFRCCDDCGLLLLLLLRLLRASSVLIVMLRCRCACGLVPGLLVGMGKWGCHWGGDAGLGRGSFRLVLLPVWFGVLALK